MLSWLELKPLQRAIEPNPLMGYCPPLELEALRRQLLDHLGLHLEQLEWNWSRLSLAQAHEQQPLDALSYRFTLAPLEGSIELFLPREQLHALSEFFLGTDNPLAQSSQEAFQDYWVGAIANSVLQVPPLQKFQAARSQLPLHGAELIQGMISAKCQEGGLTIQILLDEKFHRSWRHYWAQKPYIAIKRQRAEELHFALRMKVAQIELPSCDLMELEVGDWISLEGSGLVEKLEGSSVELLLEEGQQLARGQIRGHTLQVTQRDELFNQLTIK